MGDSAETQPLDLERFRVNNPDEIARVMRDLSRATRLVTAYFNEGHDFIITSILGLDPKSRRMLLDYGPDEEMNQRLVENGTAILVANHNQVRVQFRIDGIEPFTYNGEPAFIVPIPESIIRVQRREFYRLSPPLSSPMVCRFMSDNGTPITARVVDISVGGIGILEPEAEGGFLCEPGTVLREVRLELPDEGGITTDIEIRNRFESDDDSAHQWRLGCMFVNLRQQHSAAIQRYIHRIELERRRVIHG